MARMDDKIKSILPITERKRYKQNRRAKPLELVSSQTTTENAIKLDSFCVSQRKEMQEKKKQTKKKKKWENVAGK